MSHNWLIELLDDDSSLKPHFKVLEKSILLIPIVSNGELVTPYFWTHCIQWKLFKQSKNVHGNQLKFFEKLWV